MHDFTVLLNFQGNVLFNSRLNTWRIETGVMIRVKGSQQQNSLDSSSVTCTVLCCVVLGHEVRSAQFSQFYEEFKIRQIHDDVQQALNRVHNRVSKYDTTQRFVLSLTCWIIGSFMIKIYLNTHEDGAEIPYFNS